MSLSLSLNVEICILDEKDGIRIYQDFSATVANNSSLDFKLFIMISICVHIHGFTFLLR